MFLYGLYVPFTKRARAERRIKFNTLSHKKHYKPQKSVCTYAFGELVGKQLAVIQGSCLIE